MQSFAEGFTAALSLCAHESQKELDSRVIACVALEDPAHRTDLVLSRCCLRTCSALSSAPGLAGSFKGEKSLHDELSRCAGKLCAASIALTASLNRTIHTTAAPVPCTSSPEDSSSTVVTSTAKERAQSAMMSAHCRRLCHSTRHCCRLSSSQSALPVRPPVSDVPARLCGSC